MGVDQIARAGTDVFAIDEAINAGSHGLMHLAWQRQRQAAIERGLHHGARQHVMRRLLERRAKLQHAVRGLARRSFDRQQARAADRQGSGLVEQDRVRPAPALRAGRRL